MEFEIMGGVVFFLGLFALMSSYSIAIIFAIFLTLFSATAGIQVSGAPIVAPYVFMLFFFIIFVRQFGFRKIITVIFSTFPGFSYFCFVIYSIFTAYVCPRLFEGSTEVYWTAHGDFQGSATVALFGLAPGNGNLTQSIYMICALVSFGLMLGMLREKNGAHYFITGMIALAGGDIISAAIDMGTYLTGTSSLIDFIHNSYAILADNEVGGFKRVVGFFSEASSFGGFNVSIFAFLLSLFTSGIRIKYTGPLCAIILGLVFLSTSTTAYVAIFIYMAFFGRSMIFAVMKRKPALALVGCVGVFAAAVVASQFLSDVSYLLDLVLFEKSGSSSAIERGDWNLQAWDNLVETYGMGAGLGSARASSYPLVLLSNVGIIGTGLYAILMNTLLRGRIPASTDRLMAPMGHACRHGLIAGLICSCISGTVMDAGLLFYFFQAGAAAALTISEAGARNPVDQIVSTAPVSA